MASRPTLLWVADFPPPLNVVEAAGERWHLSPYLQDEPLQDQLGRAQMALVGMGNGWDRDPQRLAVVLEALDHTSAVAIFLLPSSAQAAWDMLSRGQGQYLCTSSDASAAELSQQIAAAASLQPVIANLQSELSVSGSFAPDSPYSEEIRMAGRLQRDFLPRSMPEVANVRFSVLFRPAGWVSGDIYDVSRLDENRVGFYVADAVGHGMPAALLTMFIKRGLQTKRIVGNSYEIIPPHEALAQLNNDICEQNVSTCHFCTAVYCIIDTSSLQLTYARAGHPEPLVIRKGGAIETLPATGSLLGIFAEEPYESQTVSLHEGDRVILYSDGLEDAFRHGDHKKDIMSLLASVAQEPRERMLLQLYAEIEDQRKQGGRIDDDITMVVMDVLKGQSPNR